MNRKQITSFLIALFISGIVSLAVYLFIFISTFDLFGTQRIIDPEGQDSGVFYPTVILFVANSLVTIIFFKKGKKSAAWGSALPIILALVIIVRIAPRYLNKSNYYEDFDKTDWFADTRRLKMGRKIVKDSVLIGFRLDEIIDRLGQPARFDSTDNQTIITYDIEESWIQLGIILNDNRVNTTQIWVRD